MPAGVWDAKESNAMHCAILAVPTIVEKYERNSISQGIAAVNGAGRDQTIALCISHLMPPNEKRPGHC